MSNQATTSPIKARAYCIAGTHWDREGVPVVVPSCGLATVRLAFKLQPEILKRIEK